jgi:RluA family pseudouridine synthase
VSGVRIVNQGPHHAVLDKPAGMVVVAGRGVPRPTLLDVAIELFGQGVRPVHRIDRVTSGLCLIAKTTYGQQALSEAFRRHFIDKRYLCVVEGVPAWKKLDVDARLARIDDPDAKKGPLAWQTVSDTGVRALTRFSVLAIGNGCALVEARPETGRMHQIRCHAAHIGHPLLGDAMYGAKERYPDEKGIALVAFAVSFPLPQSGRAFIVGEPPTSFMQLLKERGIDPAPLAALAEKFKKPANAIPAKPSHRPEQPRHGKKDERRFGKPHGNGPTKPSKRGATPRPKGPRAPSGPPGRQSSKSAGSARSERGRPGDRRGR